MSRKKVDPAPGEEAGTALVPESPAPAVPEWSVEELLAVSHLGPAIIGRPMYEAAQRYVKEHGATSALGPATRGA